MWWRCLPRLSRHLGHRRQEIERIMSKGFNILLSPPSEGFNQPIEVYKRLVTVLLESPSISSDSSWFKVYRGQLPFDLGSDRNDPHVIFQLPPNKTITVQKVFDILDSVQSEEIYVGVSLGYERREWNNEICDSELSMGSLTVEYEAPTFGGGFRNRRLGPYHLLFDNLKYFSPYVVDLAKCPATSPEALVNLGQYGHNIVLVQNFFKQIAAAIRPQHQVLITEGNRVNPLLFHMVYHNAPWGYLFDVQKIIQLHTYGGGYFYEGRERGIEPYDREGDFDPPYSMLNAQSVRYGDSIRLVDEAEELERKLDSYSKILGEISLNKYAIDEQVILDAMRSANVESETLDGGMCASSPKFLLGYLDRFYLQFLETLIAPIESSTSEPS